ncbi:MAG: hypothetical protein ACJA2P_000830, partial [Rhodoferax sp.]
SLGCQTGDWQLVPEDYIALQVETLLHGLGNALAQPGSTI